MLHYKDRSQLELPINMTGLSDKKFSFLHGSIYHLFRTKILPILPVKIFKKYFSETTGRKSKDIQSMIGLFILQALFDMTEKQAVEAHNFDQRFHYALDLKGRDAYLGLRTFYYYKEKILGKGRDIFDAVLDQIDELISLDTSMQRTDSTLVKLNLKKMSQWELFKTVLIKVLSDIKSEFQAEFETLPEGLRLYVQDSESNTWFTGFAPSKAKEYVHQAARDALTLKDLFENHPEISIREPFQLLLRLIQEQVSVTEDDQLKVEIKDEHKGSALSNPHDPEAQYNGHKKSAGAKLTLSETCSQDTEDPHIIVNVEVDKANVSDTEILLETIEHREEKGRQPEVELTDNGFESDENHQALRDKGIDLVAPPTGEAPDGFGILDFELDESDHTIKSCPMEQPCLENKVNLKRKKTSSYFDIHQCQACPHLHDCPVKISKRKAKVDWNWNKPRLEAKRLIFEQDNETIELFRLRSGGEAPFSELKNTLGLKRLRVRGLAKAKLAIVLRVIGLNLRRLYNWIGNGQGIGASKTREKWLSARFLSFLRLTEPVNSPCESVIYQMAA